MILHQGTNCLQAQIVVNCFLDILLFLFYDYFKRPIIKSEYTEYKEEYF